MKDENHVFLDSQVISDDPDNFEFSDSIYVKDSFKVYIMGEWFELEGSDIATFEIISGNYAKDKNFVYMGQYVVKDADPETYIQLEDEFAKDKNLVFHRSLKVNNADPDSFQVLESKYAKDKNNAYYSTMLIKDVDAQTFEVVDGVPQDKYFYFDRTGISGNKNVLAEKLKGKIVLKVEENGEAYYINPSTFTVNYLGRPTDAFKVMREQGVGIHDDWLEKIPVGGDCPSYNQDCNDIKWDDLNYAQKQKGRIFLQVEQNGEAWYVNPADAKRYFLGRPADAFSIMRELGLGISNDDFSKL